MHTIHSGYCTNVHAGTDLDSILENLRAYAGPAREIARPHSPLGIGLWLPAEAASQLRQSPERLAELRDTCEQLGLEVFTFNGFPFGNFHQKVVKHRVYEPNWADAARLNYTLDLFAILDTLLPEGTTGSISTLPIGWSELPNDSLKSAANHLRQAAHALRQLEHQSGRRIVLALEPEPGCTLDTAEDVIAFFNAWIAPEDKRYITVCHDVCHSAVMFEAQDEVLRKYAEHEITVGKFQISSAISVPWNEMSEAEKLDALKQLRGFAEDRYLHQTGRKTTSGHFTLAEDLPELLASIPADLQHQKQTVPFGLDDAQWCIHFHVPIHLRRFGQLRATQDQIFECLRTLKHIPSHLWITHFEIETYAWGVLPEPMRQSGLAESIAAEVRWFDKEAEPLIV